MALPNLTGKMRLARDPDMRFTPGGKAVCSVALVTSERRKNRDTDEWEDGDRSPFITATLWERDAEQLVEAGLAQGELVLVTGQLFAREYERNDGSKGQSIELKYATVAPVPGGKPRADRERGGQQGTQGSYQRNQQGGPPAGDPWATPSSDPWAGPGTSAAGPWRADRVPDDEPPF